MPTTHPAARSARVGDLLPLGRDRARRIDASAVLVPGARRTASYLASLEARRDDFAAWDGRVVVLARDGREQHRLLIVDRYGQVYAVHESPEADALPDADAVEEWFRFLATACPECGVLDDPVAAGPTP